MFSTNYLDNTDTYRLTHPQKRIWYIEKIYPNTSIYNIAGTSRIKGFVDYKHLDEAIQILIKTNDGIRLHIVEDNGVPKQYIKPYERIKIDFFDFSIYDDPETELAVWVERKVLEPFTVEDELLFYFAIFKLTDNDNGYFVKIHHIVSDGWTFNLLSQQISENYTRLIRNEEVNDASRYSYIEYIEQESTYLSSERFEKDKIFWNERFANLPENIIIEGTHSISGKRSTFFLEENISSKIKKFVDENKCSVNTFFVSLVLLYLSITYQQEDIIIGTPVLNRSGKRERNTFGMFTSTMPFRMAFDSKKLTFFELSKQVNSELKTCYFHQHYPYDLLALDLGIKKKGYDSLFQICVNFYNTKMLTDMDGVRVENSEHYNGNQLFPLQLVIKDWLENGELQLDFDYKTDIYTQKQITDMFNHLTNLMVQVLNAPNETLRNFTYLTENEKNEIVYGFNSNKADYPKNKTICQLIQEQVERTPDKVAVCFEDASLTYSELNGRANQLARFLRINGVERESIVGLMVTHSIEMVIGILGIMKAGGAYLPIDPEYPDDRKKYLLRDSSVSVLLTNCTLNEKFNFNGRIFKFDNNLIFNEDKQNLDLESSPKDLAYIIYTSGSTGNPKGVMIENQGLVNYIYWAKKIYVKSDADIFALYSSLSFDLTVTSIFTPLIGGNKIIVYQKDEDEYVLYKIMRENKVSIIKLTPSHLSLLKGMDFSESSVKRFIVGGEDLKVNLAASIHESFNGKIEIYNEYGPTETVVGCMIYKYDYENDTSTSVPIGVPADNVQIYILDDSLKPLPKGCCGEMYISGDGIARGYLNRKELTSERFIGNPYIIGTRLYKTGDYARYINNGIIEYIGRMDHQVKIRGHRIELGEIEKYLLDIEFIKDAVVIDHEDKSGNKYLFAYVTATKEFSEEKARKYLAKLLPDYMLPSHIICMDKLPLTSNGKIDRRLLPQPKQIQKKIEYIAPRNDSEEKLIAVMQNVLGINEIGMKDDFYRLGGDSIKAIQAASKLNQIGLKIRVKDILTNPVFEEIALNMENSLTVGDIDQSPCEGYVEQIPIYSWFFSQSFKDINYYNQSIMLILKHNIDCYSIQGAFNELIRYHDALRLVYDEKIGRMFFNPDCKSKIFEVPEFDLSADKYDEQDKHMLLLSEGIKSSIDIRKGPLIKSCIFNLGGRGKRLLITAHHLVVDGVSWRILLEDFATLLQQIIDGNAVKLPAKTLSYQKWACALKDYAKKISLKEDYFKENQDVDRSFIFTSDHNLGDDTIKNCHSICGELTESNTKNLLKYANTSYGTHSDEILLISFILTLSEFWGKENIGLELEGHGRDEIVKDINISRTVGWFTNIYPAIFKVKNENLSYKIKSLKEQIKEASAKGMELGINRFINNWSKEVSLKYIRYNYLGEFNGTEDYGIFEIMEGDVRIDCSDQNEATALIDVNSMVLKDKLKITFTYSRNRFLDETIEKLMNLYLSNIESIIQHCCSITTKEFTPSDFDTIDVSQDELDELFN